MIVFIVTEYACNSSPSDMVTPTSKLFTDYAEAYEYFLKVSPPIDRSLAYYQELNQRVNSAYDPNSGNNGYIVIESRCQTCVGDKRDTSYAKRPYGAVIARYIM
jgi:hypothetical protein